MVEWYGKGPTGEKGHTFDVTQFGMDPGAMLKAFWRSLIDQARGSTVYFHNRAGYDSILSLGALLSHHQSGLTFTPIVRNGRLISLGVFQLLKGKNTLLFTIKDSFKLLPAALGKLAKDFKVVQKGHFPHYFNPLEHGDTLEYVGPLPWRSPILYWSFNLTNNQTRPKPLAPLPLCPDGRAAWKAKGPAQGRGALGASGRPLDLGPGGGGGVQLESFYFGEL
jgi:hypothetical protein